MNDMDMAATKKDVRDAVDDILELLSTMMTRIDERFLDNERRIIRLHDDMITVSAQVHDVQRQLDISGMSDW